MSPFLHIDKVITAVDVIRLSTPQLHPQGTKSSEADAFGWRLVEHPWLTLKVHAGLPMSRVTVQYGQTASYG
eukprot:scaffold61486_cov28-Tisochrysis_lutea.AAC.5